MLQNYLKFPHRNVQTFGFVYQDTNGLNHGPVWKIQSFLLNEICMVILWQGCYGKGNLRKSYWNMDGRKFQIGNVSSFILKKDYSYLCMWMTQNWLERQTLTRCGKYSIKKLIWENQHLSSIMSCQEMCGTMLWVGKQDDSTTLQSINSMHWWPSFQRRRIEIRGRTVKSILSNCSEMLILGTHWWTRYSVVSEQTCTIDYQMDLSVWQTPESFDILHISDMWIETILPCGKHCQTMQIRTVSSLRFCRRSWGFKIYIRCSIVRFWKSYICSNQLDV